jgi:type IV secretion system protein VirD4
VIIRLAIATSALLLCVLGWEVATTMAAARLLPGSLGAPLFTLGSVAIHAPWKWMLWTLAFGAHVPETLRAVQAVGFGTVAGVMVLLVVANNARSPKPRSDAYGSARWATDEDLRLAGLGSEGVVLCQTADASYEAVVRSNAAVQWRMKQSGALLCDDGPGHVLCFAPTRSGKGVGLVIPTLLTWRGSALVYDIKKELWHATAGWRRQFSHCWRFEPTSPSSVRFNPLFEIPRGPGDVRQAQNIADIVIDPDGNDQRRDHWEKTARDLIVGAILHVLYAGHRKSLAGVYELLSDSKLTQQQILETMMATLHLGDQSHPQVVNAARAAHNKSPNERSGVFSTALACLGLFIDPIVAHNTDASDFTIAQLNSLEHPVSLYIVVPPSDIDRLRPLVRLMLNQIGKRLCESMELLAPARSEGWLTRLRNLLGEQKPTASLKNHRLLYLIDEFPSLGRLPFFESAMAFAAGYGIKFFLVAQSLNQLDRYYGANNSFLDNSQVQVTYTARDERTAKRISDMHGQRTNVLTRQTRSKKRGALWFDSVSEAEHEHGRSLLTADEILTLPFDQALLLVGGMPPYRGKKVMFYQDERFKARAFWNAPESPEEQAAELPSGVPVSVWQEAAIGTVALTASIAPGIEEQQSEAESIDPPCDRSFEEDQLEDTPW